MCVCVCVCSLGACVSVRMCGSDGSGRVMDCLVHNLGVEGERERGRGTKERCLTKGVRIIREKETKATQSLGAES